MEVPEKTEPAVENIFSHMPDRRGKKTTTFTPPTLQKKGKLKKGAHVAFAVS